MRRKLLAPFLMAALLGTAGSAMAQDAPPTKTTPRPRRAPRPRKDPGPVINAIGFDKLPDGSTRLYVELSRKVPMTPSGSGRELVFTLSGAHVGSFNDSLPIDTRYQNTPILRARAVQKKKDVEVHVSLRADAKPNVGLTDLDGGRALLTIDFAPGDFVKQETPEPETLPPAAPTPVTMPGTTGSATPARNQPAPTASNPHADDPDYVPRAGTEETVDGRSGSSSSAEAPLPPRQAYGSIGLLAGYGFGDTNNGFPNLYSAGFGAQLGYTFGSGVYLGAVGVYHLGASQSETVENIQISVKGQWLLLGGELGYDFRPGDFIIRPAVELGYARLGVTASAGNVSQSDSKGYFQFAPALDVLYAFGSGFIGVEGRYWYVSVNRDTDTTLGDSSASAPAVYGTLGATF